MLQHKLITADGSSSLKAILLIACRKNPNEHQIITMVNIANHREKTQTAPFS